MMKFGAELHADWHNNIYFRAGCDGTTVSLNSRCCDGNAFGRNELVRDFTTTVMTDDDVL